QPIFTAAPCIAARARAASCSLSVSGRTSKTPLQGGSGLKQTSDPPRQEAAHPVKCERPEPDSLLCRVLRKLQILKRRSAINSAKLLQPEIDHMQEVRQLPSPMDDSDNIYLHALSAMHI